MKVSPLHGRVDAFARLLDGAAVEAEPGLAALAGLAGRLQALPVGPDPDFRAALRGRLVAVATVRPPEPGRARPAAVAALSGWRVQRRLRFAAGVAAAVIAVSGVAVSASRSVPGDLFYALKRGTESVQLALASGKLDKGRLELEFARTRLHEVRVLVSGGAAAGAASPGYLDAAALALGGSTAQRVTAALRAMNSETLTGSQDLTSYFATSGDTSALRLLHHFATTQQQALVSLLPAIPAAARAVAQASVTVLSEVGDRASALLTPAACTATCVPVVGPKVTIQPSPRPTDTVGVQPCTCITPSPVAASPSSSSTSSPTSSPSPAPSPTSSPSASPSPSSTFPVPLPSLPVPLPTPSVSLPSLPVPLPTPSVSLPAAP